MELYIDTADVNEIKEIAEWGVLSGVTTNPTLISRSGRDFLEVIKEICEIVDGPVSAEVISEDIAGMIKEGRAKKEWHENVVIKLPCTPEGIGACAVLENEGIPCNVTLVFSAAQGYLAACAGATFVSPFVGRLDDAGSNGMQVVEDLADMFELHNFPTRIIAASIRTPNHITEAALAGAHIATVPYSVIKKSVLHPLTDKGLDSFKKDWEAAQK